VLDFHDASRENTSPSSIEDGARSGSEKHGPREKIANRARDESKLAASRGRRISCAQINEGHMGSPAATYVRGLHQKFDFYAAWPPNQARRLGDVGRMTEGKFERVSTLELLGISFTDRQGPTGSDLSHTSGSSVSIQLKAKGETLPGTSIPNAKAGALVEFSSEGAFVFLAAAPAVREIEDQVRLADDILRLFRKVDSGKRAWSEDWCVVTELMTASKVTVLVSSSGSSKIELSADGVPAGQAPLATLGGTLSVVTQRGEVTSVLAEANLTPLFRVSRVRRNLVEDLFGGDASAQLRPAGVPGAQPAAAKRVLEPVPLNEALAPALKKGRAPAKPGRPRSKKRGKASPKPRLKTKASKTRGRRPRAKSSGKKKSPSGRRSNRRR